MKAGTVAAMCSTAGVRTTGGVMNLTNSTLSCLTELLLWDTNSVWHLTTMLVDDINILLRN